MSWQIQQRRKSNDFWDSTSGTIPRNLKVTVYLALISFSLSWINSDLNATICFIKQAPRRPGGGFGPFSNFGLWGYQILQSY